MELSVINKIINPVHLLSVEDKWDIAKAILKEKTGGYLEPSTHQLRLLQEYHAIDKRWEELIIGKSEMKSRHDYDITQGKLQVFEHALLKKEHFVCEAEKPNEHATGNYKDFKQSDYQSAKEKVWFEGFDWDGKGIGYSNKVRVSFHRNNSTLWHGCSIVMGNPTIFDFIIEIDRYNRTASTPIELKFTAAFVNQLLQ